MKFVLKIVLVIILLTLLSGCKVKQKDEGVSIVENAPNLFLPLVTNYETPVETFGVVSEGPLCRWWYRENSPQKIMVRWTDVEKREGVFDWSSVDDDLCGHRAYMINVTTTPSWALPSGGDICELPKDEEKAFEFYKRIIDRYHPVYLEIWNEPDTRKEDMPVNHYYYYGCIGDGIAYGEFVDHFYKYIQPTTTKIVIGALSNTKTDFLPEMLSEVDEIDALSFHCYEHSYSGGLTNWCLGILEAVQKLVDVEVIVSEGAVLYRSGSIASYEEAQKQFFQRMSNLLAKFFWYTVGPNGWPVCELFPCGTDFVYRDRELSKVVARPVWFLYFYR